MPARLCFATLAPMLVTPIKVRPLLPPKDDLYAAIKESKLKLDDGDVIAVTSKVVAIQEGCALPIEGTDKLELIKKEADWFYKPKKSKYRKNFTIVRGLLVSSSGIDQSNGNGYFTYYPKDPQKSAARIRTWLMREYKLKKLGLIITDSMSIPLRRGAIGTALAYAGFAPLKDYRGTKDLFGRAFTSEVANIADGLAATAVLAMGEGGEGTPLVVIRGAKSVSFGAYGKNKEPLVVSLDNDVFAPFLNNGKWKKGGAI